MHRVYLLDHILSRNNDIGITSISHVPYITVEVGMYRAGYRVLYEEVLTEHKHSSVFNLI